MRSSTGTERRRLPVVGPGPRAKCRKRYDLWQVEIRASFLGHVAPLVSERDPEDRQQTKSQHGLIE